MGARGNAQAGAGLLQLRGNGGITSTAKTSPSACPPGGIARAWVGGPCQESIEIGRFEAAISKVGPDQGRSNGQYALPLTPESKAYIDAHGVPYGSW